MNNIKFIAVLLIVLLSAISTFSQTQDSIRLLILSDVTGVVIDAKEKEKYNLFPKFGDEFISAMFYMDDDNQFYCKVKLKSGNSFKDSTISYSYNSIKNIAAHIQYKEKGDSFNINNDVVIKLTNGKILEQLSSTSSQFSTNKIPLAKTDIDYSQFVGKGLEPGLSSGIIINPYNYKDLSQIFYEIAKEVVKEPDEVNESDFVINSFPLFSISSVFIISNSFSLEFEYSFGGREKGMSSVSYKGFSFSGAYLYPLSRNISPYLSVGYSGFNFTATQIYGALPIQKDDMGSLESISLKGNGGGLKLSIGMIYKVSDFISFNLFGSYRFISPLKFGSQYSYYIGHDVTYKMKGFEIGLKILFR